MGKNLYQSYLKLYHQKVKLKCLLLLVKLLKNWDLANVELVKAFYEKRNRIGEYELEWLEPELDVHPKAATRIERLKKTFTRTVCIYCNEPLTREDRVKNGFDISKLSERLDIR